jgi:sortase B
MSNTSWKVDGRSFQYKKDYMDALEDKKIITKIKEQYNINDLDSLTLLINEVEKETFQFKTLLGQDYIDDIYQYHDDLKKKKKSENDQINVNKKKKSKKQKKQSKQEKSKKISMHDFDEDMQEQIKMELHRKERRRVWIIVLSLLVAIGSLSYFFIYDYMEKRTASNVEDWSELKDQADNAQSGKEFQFIPNLTSEEIDIDDLEVLEEYQILTQKNKTLIGWIKIDDTYIDYPVMQAADNEYYLSYNFNQEKDNNGSIFLDYQSDFVNRDTNLILYGHNMKSGRMFGSLRNYQNEEYYHEHSTIQFDTIYEKGVYEIMYVFHGQIYTEEDIAFKYYQFFNASTEVEFNSYMNSMKEISLYDTGVKATYGDQLLTLSTCDTGGDYSTRFVVVAKRIK